jgi:hypothetical protein
LSPPLALWRKRTAAGSLSLRTTSFDWLRGIMLPLRDELPAELAEEGAGKSKLPVGRVCRGAERVGDERGVICGVI